MKLPDSFASVGLMAAALAAPLGALADDPAWIPINPPAAAPAQTASATWSAFDNIWMCLVIPGMLDRFNTTEPQGFILEFK